MCGVVIRYGVLIRLAFLILPWEDVERLTNYSNLVSYILHSFESSPVTRSAELLVEFLQAMWFGAHGINIVD